MYGVDKAYQVGVLQWRLKKKEKEKATDVFFKTEGYDENLL